MSNSPWTPAQHAYIQALVKKIGTETGQVVRERINKLVDESQATIDESASLIKTYVDREFEDIEKRIKELESNQIEYTGPWSDAKAYRKNHVLTHDGSLWFAVRATQPGEKPGASDGFRLAVKRGRDAR